MSNRYRARGEKPPYVPRYVDEVLTQTLKQDDFVLIVGPAKAGKTRTGYETLRKATPLTTMLVPCRPEDLGKIVEGLQRWSNLPNRAVLWL